MGLGAQNRGQLQEQSGEAINWSICACLCVCVYVCVCVCGVVSLVIITCAKFLATV